MNNSLREGSNYYGNNSTNNKKRDITQFKYPKGYFPMFSIIIVEIIILIIVLIGINQKWYQLTINWYDALLAIFVIGFSLNCLWLIARQNFGTGSKFAIKQIKDKITFKSKRKHKNLVNYNFASNNVVSIEDYQKFINERSKQSKKIFWISFSFQGFGLLISIIIELCFVFIK
ncbi:hypothetical protein [Mycoplasmoides pirum]|uniref:hypothetical protein n=1 Tax=Mycoplasmoides pirum TaxID=2122 RepID=UPI0004821906|nr:hypothetical protein [Mycoplasmoides pirum]